MRLMLIDDDPSILQTFGRYFEALNYECQCFNNPLNALEAYKSGDFDLVITDYQMPQMNGLDVLRRIMQYDANANCIMMSGCPDREVADSAREIGALHFMQKPFNLQAFQLMLTQLTSQPMN